MIDEDDIEAEGPNHEKAKVSLVAVVERELGATAVEEAERNFGKKAIVMVRGNPWMHLRRGRWVTEGQGGLILCDETMPGLARTILVRDGAVVDAKARPIGDPASN